MTTGFGRACYLAWVGLLSLAYFMWPALHTYSWLVLGLSGAAAIVVGVRVNRPAQRVPWYLIAAGLVLFVAGDTLYNVTVMTGGTVTSPMFSDLLYLLMYPLIATGLLLFVRARSGARNRAALLDALVPTVSLGLLSWVYMIAPYARDTDLTLLQKVVSVAYPLGDVLALAILLQLLTTPGRKPVPVRLLTAGIIGLLLSDVVYSLGLLNSDWINGGVPDVGWIAFYALTGLAGLHPAMARTPAEDALAAPRPGTAARRLLLLTSASLIAPAVLLAQHLGGEVVDAPVIAAAAALMFALVMARVHGLITEQVRAQDRERALREATTAFAVATTVEQVRAAGRTTVEQLLPAGEDHHVIQDREQPGPMEPGVRLVETGGAFPHALITTAVLPGLPLRSVSMRILAPLPVLHDLRPAVQALYAQFTLVVQRIALASEVSRRDGEAYFRTLIQSTSDVILIVGEDDHIRYASPSATTLLGHEDLVGTPLTAIIADTHHEALRDELLLARAGRTGIDGVDLTAVRADRRLLQIECSSRDLRADSTVRGLVLTMRDVTERRRLENDLAHQAFHDGLTGLANRVLFRDRLEHSYARAALSGGGVGVLFVDLDDFKEVNDTLGHAVGDQLLVVVAERITQAVGRFNTAARMGGDEFAILVEDAGDPSAAEEVAARVVAALSAPVEVSDGLGGTNIVSGAASVGVASSADATSPTELLRHADLALYLAKGAGKGDWRRYRHDLHAAMVERLALRTSLHEAVENEQFVLQYQPIVDVRTQIVHGLEALVRWQHPDRGLLSPYHFIELAEESGAIVPIGEWVLRESLRQFAQWHRENPQTTLRYISVNVSARQFRQPGFVDRVRAALADAGAHPRWLLLEITESLVLRDAEQVWADLGELRELGVRIAIDDFGTGYSSLSYLRQMPVDVLKIDKSFIDDILASKQQRALVNAIVTLARNLDLTVVAEGIESADQRAMLGRMGCPYGQGYLFSKPVWPAEIPTLTGAGVTVSSSV